MKQLTNYNTNQITHMKKDKQVKPNKNVSHLEPLLLEILSIQNPSCNDITKIQTIEKIMSLIPRQMFVEEDKEGNLLFDNRPVKKRTKAVPTIVAHLDQVHDYERGYHFALIGDDKLVAYDYRDKRCGTGGDDKCGIYVAIKMLLSDVPCRAIFVQDEEVGCVGSGEVNAEWGTMSSILLQADRRGNNDLIMHTNGVLVADKELVDRVLALPVCSGMKPEYGSITDIGELCQTFDVSGFNISSGYYEAHSHKEYIKLSELQQCFDRVYAIASMVGNDVQSFPAQPVRAYRRSSYGGTYDWGAWDDRDEWSPTPTTNRKTLEAGKTYVSNLGIEVGPMQYSKESGTFWCSDFDVINSINHYMDKAFTRLAYTSTGMCLNSRELDIDPIFI
jgi:hypothetical protein